MQSLESALNFLLSVPVFSDHAQDLARLLTIIKIRSVLYILAFTPHGDEPAPDAEVSDRAWRSHLELLCGAQETALGEMDSDALIDDLVLLRRLAIKRKSFFEDMIRLEIQYGVTHERQAYMAEMPKLEVAAGPAAHAIIS